MKVSATVAATVLAFASALPAFTQNRSTVRTVSPKEEKKDLSVRAQSLYDTSGITEADIPWIRVIYRSLDLTQEKNMPLYYPEESMEDQENMFRLIVRLMADGKIPVFEYLDGREIFTDTYRLNVKDVLDRYYIPYEETEGRKPAYTIDDSDIPANEVLTYYIREKWVFDQRNSKFYPMVEALCPVLHRAGDFGGDAVKYPMFWVRYTDVKPYLSQQYILTNNENNVQQYTFDDYFQLRMFDGEIYKTTNLRNMSLMQMYPSDTARIEAQNKIEEQLKSFEDNLWVKSPQAAAVTGKDKNAAKENAAAVQSENAAAPAAAEARPARSSRGTAAARPAASSASARPAKTKTSAPKSSPAGSSAAPVRSVRRTK